MRRKLVHTGLTGKYMNTQMRIVMYSGSEIRRKMRMVTENDSLNSYQKVKETSVYQDAEELILTGWEF
jgi:hypothetical protein